MDFHVEEENGFSAIEILLSLIIVILITFVGYYIYHAQKNTNDTYNSAAKVAQSTAPKTSTQKSATSTQQFETISEWGVRAPVNTSPKLVYTIDSSNPNVADFTTAVLKASDPNCSDPNAAAVIDRYKPTDQVVGELAANAADGTAASVAAAIDSSRYAFVGGYYYFVEGPQTTCGTSQASQTDQKDATTAVTALLPKLVSIQ